MARMTLATFTITSALVAGIVSAPALGNNYDVSKMDLNLARVSLEDVHRSLQLLRVMDTPAELKTVLGL
ncbi:MAG: hypothetical protein Q7T94_11105 [Rugosibacter sp.]|nr:hypothetical protein [Rugosibacter sp.]